MQVSPKWIMEDLGYCTLFCYCTMYSHFHFLWVGSKNMFLYMYKHFENQYSETNLSLVLKAEDLEGFRLYASEYA